jgi:predicted phosphate transport protein (TIGR00153 family)
MKTSDSKRKVEEIMREFNNVLLECVKLFSEAVHTLCDNQIEEFNKKVEQIIQVEEKSDGLKDELIEKFMKKEAMAFTRADRIQLIENLDMIVDDIEYSARAMQINSIIIKDYSIIADHFKKFSDDLEAVVKTLANAVTLAEENLEKAIEATKAVEKLRDPARTHSFQIMTEILKSDLKNLEKMLLYRNTEYLLAILDKAEETSDYLRMIAIKYLVIG